MRLDLPARFAEFDAWHQDARTRACHDVGLPVITTSVLGALARVPAGSIDLGLVLLVGTLVFDLLLAPRLAPVVFVIGLACWAVGAALPGWALVAAFGLGWAFQLVGHRVFEGNRPAFTTNLVHLVVGPRWLARRWLRAVGAA